MLNRICFIGTIGKEPEIRKTQTGVSVMSIDIACKRDRKENGENVVDWITTVFWRGSADFLANYAHKGDVVAVEGRLQSRKWTDKDGKNRINWEVQADSVSIVKHKPIEEKTAEETHYEVIEETEEPGDLPF